MRAKLNTYSEWLSIEIVEAIIKAIEEDIEYGIKKEPVYYLIDEILQINDICQIKKIIKEDLVNMLTHYYILNRKRGMV